MAGLSMKLFIYMSRCWVSVCICISILRTTTKLRREKWKRNSLNKKWSDKVIKFTVSQSQNSLWTSCLSNPFHPHELTLNVEALNQTLAPGCQGQCSCTPKSDTIQSDLYWLISLFATPNDGNNRVGLNGDTWGDPWKLAMGKKEATSSTFAFSRSFQVGHKG